jgi:hypothetical protein
MRELGYSAEEIATLQKDRAIMIWSPEAEAAGGLPLVWPTSKPAEPKGAAAAAE